MSGRRGEQLTEEHFDLLAGQMGPQAEVRTGRSEAQMRVRGTPHVEGVGVLERVFITVGGVVEQEQLLAGDQLLAAEHGVFGDRAAHPDDGGAPPHDLVHARGGDPCRVGLPARPLIGVLRKGQKAVADGIAGRVVPGDHQKDEEGRHFGWGERLTVDVAVDEGRGDVVGRVAPAGLGQLGHERGERLRSLHQRH